MLLSRRAFVGSLACTPFALAQDDPPVKKPTTFQVACMTLPYSAFPLQRALEGLNVKAPEQRNVAAATQ